MTNHHSDVAWEEFGRQDPYFGVLSDDRFRSAGQSGAARDEFFRSGDLHVERVFATLRSNVNAGFAPVRALDFGCGVGRLLIPLGKRVPEVTGMDVSGAMLDEAQRNCDEVGVHNVRLVRSDDQLSALEGRYDLIHSFIVFQHIPVARGERLLAGLLDRLDEKGVAAVHFSYGQDLSLGREIVQAARFRVPGVQAAINLLKRRPVHYPRMDMHRYRTDRLLDILREGGCHQAHLRFSLHGPYRGVFIFAEKSSVEDF